MIGGLTSAAARLARRGSSRLPPSRLATSRLATSRLARGVVAAAAITAAPSLAAAAPPRQTFVDVEPVATYFSFAGHSRTTIAGVGATVGLGAGALVPYVGGSLGMYSIMARVGLLWLPAGRISNGLMLRAEARPRAFLSPCLEPAVFGNLGVGYRWELQPSFSEKRPSPALFLLPSVGGGQAWIRPLCEGRGSDDARVGTFLLGGTLALGLDF